MSCLLEEDTKENRQPRQWSQSLEYSISQGVLTTSLPWRLTQEQCYESKRMCVNCKQKSRTPKGPTVQRGLRPLCASLGKKLRVVRKQREGGWMTFSVYKTGSWRVQKHFVAAIQAHPVRMKTILDSASSSFLSSLPPCRILSGIRSQIDDDTKPSHHNHRRLCHKRTSLVEFRWIVCGIWWLMV